MSSPVDENGKRDDHSASAYAPKWVRDSSRETSQESPSIGEDKYPQQTEQSFPEKGPASDQVRAHRPLHTTFTRDAQVPPRAWSRRAETELPESDEEPPLRMPRSLDPQFMKDPPRARRALGRLAAVGGLIIAASVGAAIALFATGKLPSELNKMLGLSADNTAIALKPAGDTKITREQPGLATAQPVIASTERPNDRLSGCKARLFPGYFRVPRRLQRNSRVICTKAQHLIQFGRKLACGEQRDCRSYRRRNDEATHGGEPPESPSSSRRVFHELRV